MRLSEYKQQLQSSGVGVDPRILQLAQANPQHTGIQNLVLESYLSSMQEEEERARREGIMQSLGLGGGMDTGPETYGSGATQYMRDPGQDRWISAQDYYGRGEEKPKGEVMGAEEREKQPEPKSDKSFFFSPMLEDDPTLLGAAISGATLPQRAIWGLGAMALDPLIQGGKFGLEGLRFIGGAAKERLSGTPEEEFWKYGEEYEPALYSKEEWEKKTKGEKEAVGSGLKAGAGIGSFALPSKFLGTKSAGTALGRVAQSAGKGALGGGLGKYSYADEPLEAEGGTEFLKGAGLGGILGGATQGVGEATRAILSKMRYGTYDVTRPFKKGELLGGSEITADELKVRKGDTSRPFERFIEGLEIFQKRATKGTLDPEDYRQALEFAGHIDDSGQTELPLMAIEDAMEKQFGKDMIATIRSQVSDVSPLGQSARGSIAKSFGLGTEQHPGLQGRTEQTADDLIRITEKYGKKLNEKGLAQSYDDLVTDLVKEAGENSDSILSRDVLKEQVKSIVKANYNIDDDIAEEFIEAAMNRSGVGADYIDPKNAIRLKKDLFDSWQRFENMTSRGGNPTKDVAVRKTLRDAVDEGLLDAVPSLKPIYRDMATLFKVAPSIAKNMDRSGYISSAFVGGLRVPLPVGGAVQGGQRMLARGKLGMDESLGGMSALSQEPGTGLSGMLGLQGAILGERGGTQQDGIQGMLSEPVAPPGTTLGAGDDVSGQYQTEQVGGTEPLGFNQNTLLQLYLSGMLSSEDVSVIQSIVGQEEEALSEDEANASVAAEDVRTMRDILSREGRGVLMQKSLPFGGFDADAQNFNTAANNVADLLGRLRTGAVINDEELKLYKSWIPKLTDTPENIKYKLDKLEQLFEKTLPKKLRGSSTGSNITEDYDAGN